MPKRISAERLHALLNYDPVTGCFTWLVARGSARQGDRAGAVNSKHGYREIGLDDENYRSGPLAWLYMTGSWPGHLVDHRNGKRDDDRWRNLRRATYEKNAQNSARHRDNLSGFKGVSLHMTGKWRARIRLNGREKSLGLFDTPESASLAYEAAARASYGEFYRAPNPEGEHFAQA